MPLKIARQLSPSGAEALPWGRSGDGTPVGFVIGDRGWWGGRRSQESARYRSALLGCMMQARWAWK